MVPSGCEPKDADPCHQENRGILEVHMGPFLLRIMIVASVAGCKPSREDQVEEARSKKIE